VVKPSRRYKLHFHFRRRSVWKFNSPITICAVLAGALPTSWEPSINGFVAAVSMEIIMSDGNDAPAPDKLYDPVALAKKHRISVEDAKAIVDKHGADRKAADKAARLIAA
jgi:hypothetical protein